MPDIAQVESDLTELLDFGRCKACRVAGSNHGDMARIDLGSLAAWHPQANPAGIALSPAWGKWRSPVSLENSMFHLLRTRITRPYRTSVALEEERVWIGFYRRVGNPA